MRSVLYFQACIVFCCDVLCCDVMCCTVRRGDSDDLSAE